MKITKATLFTERGASLNSKEAQIINFSNLLSNEIESKFEISVLLVITITTPVIKMELARESTLKRVLRIEWGQGRTVLSIQGFQQKDILMKFREGHELYEELLPWVKGEADLEETSLKKLALYFTASEV